MKQKKILVTHNGSFHTDDVFACAALELYLEMRGEEWEVKRTRDEEIIASADYVVDVGGVYNKDKNRFDHHQHGGAGKHVSMSGEPGIDYSSFGLVWEKFGEELAGASAAAKLIENNLVSPIDAFDNGIDLVENKHKVSPYYLQHIFFALRPAWNESTNIDEIFLRAVELAKEILGREIIQTKSLLEAKDRMSVIYKNSKDKRILILDKHYTDEIEAGDFPETLFFIYPRKSDGLWGVKCARVGLRTFQNKKSLPESWAGLRDEALARTSGVMDAVFCHRGRYFCVAKSQGGAIKLAELALENGIR
ncbi:MAG: MYG1 family protein [Patescibacteria group bacterium]